MNMQTQFDQWYNNLHMRGVSIPVGETSPDQTASASSCSIPHISSNGSTMIGLTSAGMAPSLSQSKTFDQHRDDRGIKATFRQVDSSAATTNSSVSIASNRAESKYGDDDVNEDIMAFYQAKEELLKRRSAN